LGKLAAKESPVYFAGDFGRAVPILVGQKIPTRQNVCFPKQTFYAASCLSDLRISGNRELGGGLERDFGNGIRIGRRRERNQQNTRDSP